MLLLKLLLTPLLTLGVTLAARAWGHRASGWLTALPIVAGPIMAVLIVEQGPDFSARVAFGTLLTLPGLAAYIVAFGWLSRRGGWLASLAGGWVVFFAVAVPLSWTAPGPHVALGFAWASLAIAWFATPRPRQATRPAHIPRTEILLRVGAAVALMLIITYGAEGLGPRLSGVLMSFPIGGSVLPAFTRALHGEDATAHLLRGFVAGLLPFPLFFYGLAVGLPLAHPAPAFVAALGAVLCGHAIVLLASRRAGTRAPATVPTPETKEGRP